MNWRFWMLAGSVCGALGIMLGAFAAHRLKDVLDPSSLALIETAHRYQMIHALALLITGFSAQRTDLRAFQVAGTCFFGGILFFSGSLYALAISSLPWLGMITPIGGLALMAGWIVLGYGLASIQS